MPKTNCVKAFKYDKSLLQYLNDHEKELKTLFKNGVLPIKTIRELQISQVLYQKCYIEGEPAGEMYKKLSKKYRISKNYIYKVFKKHQLPYIK